MLNRKLKSIVGFIFALCLCFALTMPAWAADNGIVQERSVEVNGYSFDIQETMDPDTYTVVRTYNNITPFSTSSDISNIDKAKALLLALGIDEENLDLWNDETILEFANGETITTSETYFKINDVENTVTQIPGDIAVAEANVIAAEQRDDFINNAKNGIEPYATAVPFNNGYIKVAHASSYQGSASYLFSTDSVWLVMPTIRSYDSIGSCAQKTTVTPGTSSGSWSYNRTYIVDGEVENKKISNTSFLDSGELNNSGWAGAAGIFRLPSDASGEGSSIKCDNFRTHYQYRGHMNMTAGHQFFNSVGTYTHTTIGLNVFPSLSIGSDGSGSGSIGVNAYSKSERYNAILEEEYFGN